MMSVAISETELDDLKLQTRSKKQRSHRSPRASRKKCILFVDDQENLRALGQGLLEHLGYEPIVAASGHDAVRLYREKNVDLVITDMCMPQMGGLELFRNLRKLDPEAKVILCSGYDMAFEVDTALDAGAYGFLSKPFDIDDMGAIIANALETA